MSDLTQSGSAAFISENPTPENTVPKNKTCPCGNPIILDGLVVKAHWVGAVCQDCESEMFRKYEARYQKALGPMPADRLLPSEKPSLSDKTAPRSPQYEFGCNCPNNSTTTECTDILYDGQGPPCPCECHSLPWIPNAD